MPLLVPNRSHKIRRTALLLFLTANFFYLIISSGRVRTIDEVSAAFLTESLVTHGSTSVPQAVTAGLFYGKFDLKHRPQTPYGLGQAFFLSPWYVGGSLALRILPGIPSSAHNFIKDAALAASNATFAALAVALAFLLLISLGISIRNSLMVVSLIGLATPLMAYSTWLFSEPIAATLLLSTSLILFGVDSSRLHFPRALLAGVVLGALVWVRPTYTIAAAIFLLALLVHDRKNGWRIALQSGSVISLFGAAFLFRNYLLFGNMLDFGYPPVSDAGIHINTFDKPILTGLYGFLFSPGKSILLFAPPVVLAVFGIKNLAKRSKGLAVIAAATPLTYLLFFARYSQWEGGFCVGPRYLVPTISLLCLTVGPLLEDNAKYFRIAACVLVAGFLIQIPGIATSFLEDQARGRYYDQNFNYRMDYAPLLSQTKLLFHYATSNAPAPLGLGFDRWFVFLSKAGVSHSLIYFVLFLEVAAALASFALLAKTLREP